MSPTAHLAAINFFTGDIQGGLGPFLSTWLAETGHWPPGRIGLVTTIVGLATLGLNTPAGALADRTGRPRALLVVACGGILAGTGMLLLSDGFALVLLAQFLAASGGTMLMPALTSLTLGIVGKEGFPKQQGRNQAFNHAGIVSAALLIGGGGLLALRDPAFIVFGAMALAAIGSVVTTPRRAWNGRRAHGWHEDEPDEKDHSHPVRAVLGNRQLLLLALTLALFNLGNGAMLSLIGQRLVVTGADATGWVALYVVVAQLTMIPVALWAGSLCDQRGRRHLLVIACAVLTVRGLVAALVSAPGWLLPVEVLDGVASGLLGVAVPVLVADLTWGSGRTQTALGTVNMLQGIGGALSGVFGGLMVDWLSWSGALLVLALCGGAALAAAIGLEETRELETRYLPAGSSG